MTASKRIIELRIACKILDRYVAREFLFSYLIAVMVVITMRILLDLFIAFDEFIESRAAAWTVLDNILDYYGPKVFEYYRDFAGTMIIMAAAFALARLARQNELTAVLASGVSLKRVIVPVVLLGFLLNFLMVLDQEFILPRLAYKLVREHDEVEKLDMIPIWLLPDRDGALVCSARYDPQSEIMYDVTIIQRQGGWVVGRITASQARWDAENKNWRLKDGIRFPITSQSENEIAQEVPVEYYESDLTAEYLWLQRHRQSKSLMSWSDLTKLFQKEAVFLKPADRKEIESERHFRVADPIINMVMLLTGLPLLVSRERRNTKTSIFLALLGAGGCFIATFVCKLLAGGALAPFWAAWLPVVVFLPIAVLVLDGIKT